jgi:KRAB domain-containing zinc finger protein
VAEHKTTHTGEKPFQCDVCKKKFSRSCHLSDHKKIHARDEPYQCDICSIRFSHLTQLADHKRKHAEEKRYECDICHQIFTQSGAITRHKRTHSGAKPFKCNICDQSFARSSSLTRHQLTHTGERLYPCCVCPQRFSRSSHLARHINRKHSEKNPMNECHEPGKSVSHNEQRSTGDCYRCDLCNKQFVDFKHLIQHKTKDHGMTKESPKISIDELTDIPCVCSLCGVSFDAPQQLEQHLNTHGVE